MGLLETENFCQKLYQELQVTKKKHLLNGLIFSGFKEMLTKAKQGLENTCMAIPQTQSPKILNTAVY